MKDCKICLIGHDDEIHAATLSIRNWFHQQVVQGFYEDEAVDAVEQPETVQAVA
jgi:hypothetical protein